jgi:hypothetical protein
VLATVSFSISGGLAAPGDVSSDAKALFLPAGGDTSAELRVFGGLSFDGEEVCDAKGGSN